MMVNLTKIENYNGDFMGRQTCLSFKEGKNDVVLH
ncbi:hypothetical protein BVRB_4g071500 [Beta vulgaris subsp. vulgaris]|nr:hypothetical protein BVRB_4g071500 [Beta vulgaris subsp. vulgaris]